MKLYANVIFGKRTCFNQIVAMGKDHGGQRGTSEGPEANSGNMRVVSQIKVSQGCAFERSQSGVCDSQNPPEANPSELHPPEVFQPHVRQLFAVHQIQISEREPAQVRKVGVHDFLGNRKGKDCQREAAQVTQPLAKPPARRWKNSRLRVFSGIPERASRPAPVRPLQ